MVLTMKAPSRGVEHRFGLEVAGGICMRKQQIRHVDIDRTVDSGQKIATRAIAYDMPGESVDGNDFSAVAQAVDQAVKRARNGDGPSLIENITYRWRGHSRFGSQSLPHERGNRGLAGKGPNSENAPDVDRTWHCRRRQDQED